MYFVVECIFKFREHNLADAEMFDGDAGADALMKEQFICTLRAIGVEMISSPGTDHDYHIRD